MSIHGIGTVGTGSDNAAGSAEDILGHTVEARDGHLYFASGSVSHPVRVMATTRTVRVGCVTLTQEAWELLKRKVDGEAN